MTLNHRPHSTIDLTHCSNDCTQSSHSWQYYSNVPASNFWNRAAAGVRSWTMAASAAAHHWPQQSTCTDSDRIKCFFIIFFTVIHSVCNKV